MRWTSRAACVGQGHLFFSPEHEDNAHRESREARAKAVCWSCGVRIRCLDFALRTDQKYGIWGGMNEADRTYVRRRHSTAEHRAQASAQESLFVAI